MRKLLVWGGVLGLLVAAGPAVAGAGHLAEPAASATGPAGTPLPELPVLHPATLVGPGGAVAGEPDHVPPGAHVVDGGVDDWLGRATGFGGTAIYSAGELVYTDHLFDSYGADDGTDADRLGRLEPLNDAVPETYRIEPVFGADVPGELGVDDFGLLSADDHYGDAERVDEADLSEVRIAADATATYLLVRTTTMTTTDQTALLVLLDTVDGSPHYDIPFGSGLHTDVADVAVLLAGGAGRAVDLATGAETPVVAAVDPTDYTNAVEAALPSLTGPSRLAVAAGRYDPATGAFADLPDLDANVANVAFRTAEPVTTWFEERQALALLAGSIDEFFIPVDVSKLLDGTNDTFAPAPGYYDRIFTSDTAISAESGTEGILQHYGVYVPSGYQADVPAPLTFWLHWRGGKAHSAATVSPRIMRDQGEAFTGLVVSPRGRGTSTWYLGKGLVDVNEVWDDVLATFSVDENRVYVSGHSMGGWGSYLLSILYPDRFAAAFPVSGPVTQGAWTGVDFDGCDDLQYEEYTPCYVAANDSDPRTQHTRRLLENLRNVPIAIYQGAADELVPVSGVTRQVERLFELGYRYRYYVFPTYEHYSHPVVDEWTDGARYVHGFTRNPNPRRVTYVRDMPFERTVETGPSQVNPTTGLSFDFDHAYWMSELTPLDDVEGVATFDGQSLALTPEPSLHLPEAGGPSSPGQVGPFVMTGITWAVSPLDATAAPTNGFEVTLTGATAVRLDLARMGITSAAPVSGTVTTDLPMELRLAGLWAAVPSVTVNGAPVAATLTNGVLAIALPAGSSTIEVTP